MTGRRMVRWLRLLAVSAAVVCLGVWIGAGSILDSQAQESGAYGKTQAYNRTRIMIRTRTIRRPGGCSMKRIS